MFEWLKNKLAAGKAWKNAAGLDPQSEVRLTADLEPLDKLSPGIVNRAMRYLLDGEDAGVLATLPGIKDAGKALVLRTNFEFAGPADRKRRVEFLEGLATRDADFLMRLARFWEAASRAGPRYLTLWLPESGLEWLEVFILEVSGYQPNSYPVRVKMVDSVTAETVEKMLVEDGRSAELLQTTVFQIPLEARWRAHAVAVFALLPGYKAAVLRHPQIVQGILGGDDLKRRLHALDWLIRIEIDPAPFADLLVPLAVSSSKQLRERCEPMLKSIPDAAAPHLESRILEGSVDERVQAIRLLWNLCGPKAKAFLESQLQEQKNARVLETIRDAVSLPSASAEVRIELPPVPPVSLDAPFGAETVDALRQALQEVSAALDKALGARKGRRQAPGLSPGNTRAVQRLLEELNPRSRFSFNRSDFELPYWVDAASKPLVEFCRRTEVKLIHLVRLLAMTSAIRRNPHGESGHSVSAAFGPFLTTYRRSHPPGFTLRDLAATLEAIGIEPDLIGTDLLGKWQGRLWTSALEPDAVWPYFAERLPMIEKAFQPSGDWYQANRRKNALSMIQLFPHVPDHLVPLLWELAFGPKADRAGAWACLEKRPETRGRILNSLRDGKSEVRTLAAEWLAQSRDTAATGELIAALKKEKNEVSKAALMGALEELGIPMEQFLNRPALLDEATNGLKKGIPGPLEWFPFASMPEVHWADEGSRVNPEVLRWFLVQACKIKDPEPGALLRRYVAGFKVSEREALGLFILGQWIAHDTAPISRADAEARAKQMAQQYVQAAQQYPKYYPPNVTFQQTYDQFLPSILKTCRQSAIDSKGILAVVASCGGGGLAPLVGRYLKEWYGKRGAQSKSLVQMLAWVDHPTAIQLMLAVGNRFRSRGIQDEAAKQAAALAERRGWTLDELGDRTIPSGGFDENSELHLDFGPRRFIARLGDDFEIELKDEQGKVQSSLPDPRSGDDADLAAESKKNLSGSKKELKSVLRMQRDRLYEAMCIQRSWRFEDWELYLHRHPVMKRLVRRVVWRTGREGVAPVTFRPLEDGSLSDEKDDVLRLQPDDVVRVAHDCNTPSETAAAWVRHLADYEIEPLFQQFGRRRFDLSKEKGEDIEIREFEGHVLEAFKLRGRATHLGYVRGPAEDGGWFFTYRKRFPTLRLEASMEFTGNSLPEENRLVALRSLSFDRLKPAEGGDSEVGKAPLGEVPSVLLNECWNDLSSFAAEGSGFDADWEKKCQP